jgi:ATP-dependent Clp protease ATP-binding subunit ClpX
VGYSAIEGTAHINRDNLMQYIAPMDLKSFGMIPEIIGRLPVISYLDPLDSDALRRILTEPKNAIVKQYLKLFELDKIKLSFEDAALDYIVGVAVEFKLGARGLRSICETIMVDAMFEMPSNGHKEFVIDEVYAREKVENAGLRLLKAS